MDTIYLVSLLVGGFFVLLSIFGGDAEAEADFDADFDADLDADFEGSDVGAGPGWVDLFSVRALFLFAAFFGLTGTLLRWTGTEEPTTAILAVLTGLVVGLGGNYAIKRVGYAHVSSDVSLRALKGSTAEVTIPFRSDDVGKISVVSRGHRLRLTARSFESAPDTFAPGDRVVIVRVDGNVAEVVKPE